MSVVVHHRLVAGRSILRSSTTDAFLTIAHMRLSHVFHGWGICAPSVSGIFFGLRSFSVTLCDRKSPILNAGTSWTQSFLSLQYQHCSRWFRLLRHHQSSFELSTDTVSIAHRCRGRPLNCGVNLVCFVEGLLRVGRRVPCSYEAVN